MTFTEKIEKHLVNNQTKLVIEEFLEVLADCPVSREDAHDDASKLRSQVIVLAGRYNSVNDKMNMGTTNPESANIEKTSITNSFVQILNDLPSSYRAFYIFINERDDENAWKDAQQTNTIDAYQYYFTKYPNGKYREETQKVILNLTEIKQQQDAKMRKVAQAEKARREEAKVNEEGVSEKASVYGGAGASTSKSGGMTISKPILYGIIGLVVIIILFFVLRKGDSDQVTVDQNDSTMATTADSQKVVAEGESSNNATSSELENPFDGTPVEEEKIIKADNVGVVQYISLDGNKTGTFTLDKRTSTKFHQYWNEVNTDGEGRFERENIDEWSVYLKKSDGTQVHIDLYRKKILVDGVDFYNISDFSD